jgi:hypothetical protein
MTFAVKLLIHLDSEAVRCQWYMNSQLYGLRSCKICSKYVTHQEHPVPTCPTGKRFAMYLAAKLAGVDMD